MERAKEIAKQTLSDSDLKRIMAERLAARLSYGGDQPNRKQRKARAAAMRRAAK